MVAINVKYCSLDAFIMIIEYPARSHGNLYIFYMVANSYEFLRPHSNKFIQFLLIVRILRVANSYEFVRITYT